MPYTLNDITPAERARLGDVDAQKIVDEWNSFEATQPVLDWKQRLTATDAGLGSRAIEEVLDFLVNGTPISDTMKSRLSNRKAIRSAQP